MRCVSTSCCAIQAPSRQIAALLQHGPSQMRPIDGIVTDGGRDVAGELASSRPPPVLTALTDSPRVVTVALQAMPVLQIVVFRSPRAHERIVMCGGCWGATVLHEGAIRSAQGRRNAAASAKYGQFRNRTL